MNSDLLFLVGLVLLSSASKSYSAVVSLVFENLFIKFFRTLSPNYVKSYARAFLLSLLSFRNQGVSFTALSFVNSGLIPNFQALGLILGSYLGLSVSLFYLNLYDTYFKFAFVVLAIVLGIFTSRDKVAHIAKMFFFLAMILFGFDLLMLSLFTLKEPQLVAVLRDLLGMSRLMVVPFALVIYFVFRNTFTALAILYVFFLRDILNHEQVLNSILSVILYNSFWYLWCTQKAHRETRGVSYAIVLITLTTGILLVGFEILFPHLIITTNKSTFSFVLSLLALSLMMGLAGWVLSYSLESFTNNFFPKNAQKEVRHIQLFTSKNHYPAAFLIEFFEQEFKKLFALLNSTQQMVIGTWNQFQDETFERTQKYFNISLKILKELEELEIQINQIEKTKTQSAIIFKIHDRLSAIKTLSLSLRMLNDIQQKFSLNRFENLREHKTLFINTSQKVLEYGEFVFSSLVEKEADESSVDPLTIAGEVSNELSKFKDELILIKSEKTFTKEEEALAYQYVEQIQQLNLAIQKMAR